jgi:hypothetical protein
LAEQKLQPMVLAYFFSFLYQSNSPEAVISANGICDVSVRLPNIACARPAGLHFRPYLAREIINAGAIQARIPVINYLSDPKGLLKF